MMDDLYWGGSYWAGSFWGDSYWAELVPFNYAEIWDGSVVMNLAIAGSVVLNKEVNNSAVMNLAIAGSVVLNKEVNNSAIMNQEITDTYSELEAI